MADNEEEWIKGKEGSNYRYKRETLLNYAANRWALNKAASVDSVMALIRKCAPKTIEEWRDYYFKNARQKKKAGIRIDEEYITDLGKRLFSVLTTTVKTDLDSITEEECVHYIFNLVINRTFEGYDSETQIIRHDLEERLGIEISEAPDEIDRTFCVDYLIKVKDKYIGIQIKPIESGHSINDYQWYEMHKERHREFQNKYGGKTFFVFSIRKGDKKVIQNLEIVDEIKDEIARLK